MDNEEPEEIFKHLQNLDLNNQLTEKIKQQIKIYIVAVRKHP
jgi:hypothetical protein